MRRRRSRSLWAVVVVAASIGSSCRSASNEDSSASKQTPTTVSVWRCRVPLSTTSEWYEPSEFRLAMTVDEIADALEPVSAWFERQSGGQWSPLFGAGGDIEIADDEGPQDCVAEAERLAQRTSLAQLVLVVADAEHRSTQPGGWGVPGVAYVGAADFHPDNGAQPPLDLVEHELGHALGWGHSGVGDQLNSGLDAMSDSAAPRAVDPTRRDAPGVLAVHRAEVGWIVETEIADLVATDATFTVASSRASDRGGRPDRQLIRLWSTTERRAPYLAVEAKADVGDDDHLERSGIVIHRVELDGDLTPLVGESPFLRPLADGETWSGDGWTIAVTALAAPAGGAERWQVSCRFGGRLPTG